MIDALRQYFKNLTNVQEHQLDHILSFFEPIQYKKNDIILRPGEICRHNYFVVKGGVRFFTVNEKGFEFTRYFAFENKFGTALSSFITKQPSIEYIQCIEETELLMIAQHHFIDLVQKDSTMNFIYQNVLEKAYITSQQRIYSLQGESALDRLKWLLDYQPDIFSRVSSKIIASYLGVTTYTLSRLKVALYKH